MAGELKTVPLISIITPVFRPSPDYFAETVKGVVTQTLPDDWELEWIVQEDGLGGPSVKSEVLNIEPVRYAANDAHLGVAATRNIALARANGEVIQILDHDDILLPGALSTLLRHFADPAIHWAVGQADNLNEDGSRTSWPSVLPFGQIEPGRANSIAIERGGNWVIHCAGLMLRTQVIRALGGWVTGWSDDDIIMFAGLSEICWGYNDPNVTWLYRQHPNQLSRAQETAARSTRARQSALQRVIAMRATGVSVTNQPISPDPVPPAGPPEKY